MVDVVTIGGSAGSMPGIIAILQALPVDYDFAVIIILHRLKNVHSEMHKVLSHNRENLKIKEPEDKELIKKHHIYLAPQNYHLLVEEDKTFSLDYSELVHHSRPAIDVTFECLAHVYGQKMVGILLSGANIDGGAGLSKIIENGGSGIVQNPASAEYTAMPQAGIDGNKRVLIQDVSQIVSYIQAINFKNR
jgi:two-component system chemotaxis response regulator CheB